MTATETLTENLTPQEVADRARPYVEKKTIGKITLSVDDRGIYLQHGYWQIPIRPSHEPKPLFPYYEALADLNEEIQEGEGFKVSIASGNPLSDEVMDSVEQTNALLAPDVRAAFPTDQELNDALRMLMRLSKQTVSLIPNP